MKRTLRLVGMAAMVLLLAASCKKEGKENGGKQMMTFSAGIEQNDGAKTGLTPQGAPSVDRFWKQFWVAGDKINVNGDEFTLSSGEGEQTATFMGETSPLEKPTEAYYAIYPVSSNATLNGTTATFTFPETQQLKYEVVGNDTIYTADFAPMAAKCTAGADVLQFQNLCTLFELRLYTKPDFQCKVKTIKLLGGNFEKVSGTYTCDLSQVNPALSYSSGGGNGLLLNCIIDEQRLVLSTDPAKPTSVLFVLPAGLTFEKGFSIVVYNDDITSQDELHVTIPEFGTVSTQSESFPGPTTGLTTIAGEVLYNKNPLLVDPSFQVGIQDGSFGTYSISGSIVVQSGVNSNYIDILEEGVIVYKRTETCPTSYSSSDSRFHKLTDESGNVPDASNGYHFQLLSIPAGDYIVRTYARYTFKDRSERFIVSGVKPDGTVTDGGCISGTVTAAAPNP